VIIIAVEKYRHPAWVGVPYAETAVHSLATALKTAGIPQDHHILLVGPDATKGVIEARFRQLADRVKKGDTLLAFISGRTIVEREATYLTAWDTLPDLAADSAVSLTGLVAALRKTKAAAVGIFLDPAGDWDERDLSAVAGITSCSPGEVSVTASVLKSSLWAHLVGEALTDDSAVSLDSIHRHVMAGLPKLLRRHAGPRTTQTPLRVGPREDLPIRDCKRTAGTTPVLDPARLSRVVFRGETRRKVKELAGFRKSHQVPATATPAARAFVARLAADDIRADLDRTYDAVREQFGYRRKDLDREPDLLRTPDFEYEVSVELDPHDPGVAVIRRDIGRLKDAAFVRSPAFVAFGKPFDSLVFEFAERLDVSGFVDGLEELPKSVATLQPSADGKSCEVTLPGVPGRILVERNSLTVRGRAGGTGGLLDLLLTFLAAVGPVGDRPAIAMAGH
jgi:hypothetical protein